LRRAHIPFANLSVILLGQGTSLTNEAARLLAEEGTLVAFTGSGGTPITFASQISYRPTNHLQRWIRVFGDNAARLAAAKALLAARCEALLTIGLALDRRIKEESLERLCGSFGRESAAAASGESLLGCEGRFAKELYQLFAKAYRLEDWRREAGQGMKAVDAGARVNAAIDHGNYLAYGLAGVVLWSLGVPASLAALHGKTRAGGLVFDLAATPKDTFVLPIAFAEGSREPAKPPDEPGFRARLIDLFAKHKALARTFDVFETVLRARPCWTSAMREVIAVCRSRKRARSRVAQVLDRYLVACEKGRLGAQAGGAGVERQLCGWSKRATQRRTRKALSQATRSRRLWPAAARMALIVSP